MALGLSLGWLEPKSVPSWVRLKNIPFEDLQVDGIDQIGKLHRFMLQLD